ncbi:NUDIX hydrolase [Hydrogenivirga sp.]
MESYLSIVKQDSHFYLRARDGAVVLMENEKGEYVFIRAKRPAFGVSIELPRGGRIEGETFEETAIREALEETGYRIRSPRFIGYIHPGTGLIVSTVAVYYAKVSEDDRIGMPCKEESYGLTFLSPEQAYELIRQGEIRDGFTLSALFLYVLKALE